MATEPIKREIITVTSDPLPYHYGGVMINTDETLISRGGGQPYGLAIYDQIERDCHAFAVLQKRKMAVVTKEWTVVPASPSRIDRKAADLVRGQLKSIDFDHVCLNLLDAILKGFAIGEVMWERTGGEVVAKSVVPKTQRRFWMGIDGRPRLLTIKNVWPGEELPDRKIICHRSGAKNDEQPYGLGLGYALFWPTYFKRQDISFWLSFLDRFADPTTIGKYPPGTGEQDKDDLMSAMRAIGTDGRIVLPDNVVIELLEAKRSSSIDSYEKLARYMDEQISECVLGETLTTNLGGGGSLAAAAVHDSVRMELCRADADLLSGTLNESLIKWIVEFNAPNAKAPKVWRDCEDPEDLKTRSDRDVNIANMGFSCDEEYINETYGTGVGRWTKKSPEELAAEGGKKIAPDITKSGFAEGGARRAPRASAKGGKRGRFEEAQPSNAMRAHDYYFGHECPLCSGSFAEDEKDTPDSIVDSLAIAAAPMTDRIIDPVRRLVEKAKNLDEIRDGLIGLYGEMDPRDLGALMARAMTLAEVQGMSEVQDGE